MAERTQKSAENVPGQYYVDDGCIAARFCIAAAPGNFRMSELGHAYVYQQPQTPAQEEECREALQGCPVDAVGDDGHD